VRRPTLAFIGNAHKPSTRSGTRTHVGTCDGFRETGMLRAPLDVVGMQLNEADQFVDAATRVCDKSRRLGVLQTAVALHFVRGPVALCVENWPTTCDDERLLFMTHRTWDESPMFRVLREHRGLKGPQEIDSLTFVSPVIGPTGWFATVIHRHTQPYGIELQRELAMLATQLSVWCTERGIAAVPDTQIDALTTRQYRIAELAARGLTNHDIAEELAISVNTVKVRLKQIFIRVGATNRTELANALRRVAPLQNVPIGITRMPSVTVTRTRTSGGVDSSKSRQPRVSSRVPQSRR
jgi:DNA-binding CsgD family transcriptional regulator